MHISILPDRRQRRDRRPGEEIKRVDTEQTQEKRERVYYSVERARNRKPDASVKITNRAAHSATRSLHKIRKPNEPELTLAKPLK
jgi:hypothetical protein